VDFRTADDAGVYAWDQGPALVQTVDFFTPIVDDPYQYGQIAAANALSDVYAMGGEPRTALAIAAFPEGELDRGTIGAIFRGGYDKLREAGAALLGGHTVQDSQIKFGYAVTGAIERGRMWTNAGARVGDRLVLTKPLGTGIVGTAIKFGRAPEAVVAQAVDSMCRLNRTAAEVLQRTAGVHACTDITGFGLIGHSTEIARASSVTLEIKSADVPILDGVLPLVSRNQSGGLKTNRDHFGPSTSISDGITQELQDLLFDPQTSGGLLAVVDAASVKNLITELAAAGVSSAMIGAVRLRGAHSVEIR
jgi:selenide,water dikinase